MHCLSQCVTDKNWIMRYILYDMTVLFLNFKSRIRFLKRSLGAKKRDCGNGILGKGYECQKNNRDNCTNTSRAVVVKLLRFNDKTKIFLNVNKLKGQNIMHQYK